MSSCNKCGNQLEPDIERCPECGWRTTKNARDVVKPSSVSYPAPSPERRFVLSKKGMIAVMVMIAFIVTVAIGAAWLDSSPSTARDDPSEGDGQNIISISTNDLILPLSELPSNWIRKSTSDTIVTSPDYLEVSSASYERRDYYSEILTIYVMRFNSTMNASAAFKEQYDSKKDDFSVSSNGIGTKGFEYDLLNRVFYLTFYRDNIVVVMKVINSDMEHLEHYARMQDDRLKS
jgi:hypothetical protein